MDNKLIGNESNIVFYEDENNNTKVEVRFIKEDVWLNVNAIANLFSVQRPAITKHINNIYNDNELNENSTCSILEHMGNDGKQHYKIKYYNLDMIISIGFRVNSKIAIKFRTWANKIIKEYMVKGFALNDQRFINGTKFDTRYFDELLERIKIIRTSERMAYQKITDIFIATSVDYDKRSEEAYTFFKIVQNKMHYAITGKTAAELIYERVNSDKLHMGLTTWKNSPDGLIYKYDVSIAKNYLNEQELKKLNNLTTLFLDYAEDMAEEHKIMTMNDWIKETDELLKFRKKNILNDSGKISHKQAMEKAENEYEKFRIKQDREYISSMDEMYKKYLEENSK
ncbi:MAG: virulence RhuM family protein [Bacilli bacterium]